jgi:hypothetical protein
MKPKIPEQAAVTLTVPFAIAGEVLRGMTGRPVSAILAPDVPEG